MKSKKVLIALYVLMIVVFVVTAKSIRNQAKAWDRISVHYK